MMDKIYEELDDAKAEIDRLRAENREKAELSESLRRAHNQQLDRIREISLELEKQRRESNEKTHEASVAGQMLEDLKCNLNEKEGIITRLSSANNKLRVDLADKIRKYEEENRELVIKLEEENAKNMNYEQKIRGLDETIKSLKGLLSVSEKKRAEAEEKGKASKEMRQRDDILLKLEEENRKLEDQLKRKREQFEHLKQAHERVQEQLQAKSKEWEKEKSTLLDEIDTMQDNLDSQTRISKDLQSRLQMCNQALAHEESRRKRLEIQLLESKTSLDNVSTECEEAKLKLESLSGQRDKEIATLRDLLATKETFYKEMEYRVRRLEQENQELVLSLKDFQEAQIQEAGSSSSMSKLRNKLKDLEQIHKERSTKFKAKEAEWRSEMEKLTEELNCCRSEQESSGKLIEELKMELEGCHSLIMQLMLQNEESSVMLLVFKSEFMEAYLKLTHEKADKDLKDMESEKDLSLLKKQLEMKNTALTKALKDVELERGEVESLSSRMVESLNQQLTLKKELDMNKEMLVESSACQVHLKEQVVQMKGNLNRVCDALDRANEELAQKFCEVNEAEFELHIWKSIAERLKANVEENYQLRKEVEASLLEQVSLEVTLKQEKEILVHVLEEKDGRIDDLQQKVSSLDQELKSREGLAQVLEEKDKRIDDHLQQKLVSLDQKFKTRETESASAASTEPPMVNEKRSGLEKEIEWWEKEWVSKELERAIFAQLEAERMYEREKKSLHQLVDEKDQRIVDLQHHVRSLEHEFENSTSSFSSQLINMKAETDLLQKAWEKFTTTVILKELEIQEKNLLIGELENDSSNLQQKLKLQEKTCSSSEVELEAKKIEIKKLTCQYNTEFRSLDNSIKNLDNEKRNLTLEKERLLGIIGELSDMIFKFYSEDMQLMGTLGRIMHNLDDNGTTSKDLKDELFDPVKENLIIPPPPPITKKVEKLPLIIPSLPSTDERSPLRALNS